MEKYKVVEDESGQGFIITNDNGDYLFYFLKEKEAAIDFCAAMNFGAELRRRDNLPSINPGESFTDFAKRTSTKKSAELNAIIASGDPWQAVTDVQKALREQHDRDHTEATEIDRQIEKTLEKGHRERIKRYTDAVAKALENDDKAVIRVDESAAQVIVEAKHGKLIALRGSGDSITQSDEAAKEAEPNAPRGGFF